MGMNVLIIKTNKEKLHDYEFVKPIEDILRNSGVSFFIRNYREVSEDDLKKTEKVIICGTSLKDNEFLGYYHKFDWLKDFNNPVLGICAGMQIIGMVFGNSSQNFISLFRNKSEIGFFNEKFEDSFLGLCGEQEVYHLHNNYVKFNSREFKIYNKGLIPQAVKHKHKEIYGVLFHPEVRQKELIKKFVDLK